MNKKSCCCYNGERRKKRDVENGYSYEEEEEKVKCAFLYYTFKYGFMPSKLYPIRIGPKKIDAVIKIFYF